MRANSSPTCSRSPESTAWPPKARRPPLVWLKNRESAAVHLAAVSLFSALVGIDLKSFLKVAALSVKGSQIRARLAIIQPLRFDANRLGKR